MEIAAKINFRAAIESRGFDFVDIGVDVEAMVSNTQMQEKAAEIGQQIRQERSVANAVHAVKTILSV